MSEKAINRFTCLTALSTVFLLLAGALVTSTGSGLAVPDWPLSFGTLMPPMVGGIFFEHGHRLVAGTVAIMTVIQAIILGKYEQRPWVRKLGYTAVGLVLLQASLGGLTVLLRLPAQVSIAHACLAQIYFCTSVVLATVTSPFWKEPVKTPIPSALGGEFLINLCLIINLGFFVQLLMGASMRHLGAALAIPDFPTAFGQILPPAWSFEIGLQFAHRTWAFVLVILVGWVAYEIQTKHFTQLRLTITVGFLLMLMSIQILLGAMIIWLKKPVPMTSTHLVIGALSFATSIALTTQVFRLVEPKKETAKLKLEYA